ncbi:MAG: hypothetical protein PHT74_06390 [Methanoculleus horonobensis]|nr:hypothetical protein [Methanoculleus horonobensis]
MRQNSVLLVALLLLALGAGCTSTPENVTPAPVLHYEQGDTSIPINVSEIPVRRFDVNATEVIGIVLADQRAGILLEGGWKIASIRAGFEEEDPNREHIDVEFRNDELSLSFFIEVDEREERATRGRCSAIVWGGRPWPDSKEPRPEDYYQNYYLPKTGQFAVIDCQNERIVMVYNKTTIFYLYPSYGDANVWDPDRSETGAPQPSHTGRTA